jgi:hypothetical protein
MNAIANTGYRFVQWNDNDTNNPRTITITQDTNLTAIFDTIRYDVTVLSNNTAWGTVTGSGNYPINRIINITATANANYRFVQWSNGATANPYPITVLSDTNLRAIFVEIGLYYVTVTTNNATMGTVTGDGDYQQNTTAIIEALAYTGYRFVQWNDGNTNNPRTITVTKDTNFTATFEAILYHLTLQINDSTMGTVTGDGDYQQNTIANIEAIANTGYRFIQWNDGNTNNPRSIIVLSDTSFIAEFEVVTVYYHLTLQVNDADRGTVTGDGDYQQNTTAIIEALAYTGYRFIQWNDGNTNNPRTITVTQDTTFEATFIISDQMRYQVRLISNSTVMGSVVGGGDYAANSTIPIGAIASANHRFVHWNDENTENPRTITVTQDTLFIATFETFNTVRTAIEISTIAVYPNPATDDIHITLPENISQAVFTLYDMQGKELIKQEVVHRDKVTINNFAAGIYIYNVVTEKENYTGKIIIKK